MMYSRAQYWSQYCSTTSLMTYIMGRGCTLSKLADNIKLEVAADIPGGCAVIQKDLNKMENGQTRNR